MCSRKSPTLSEQKSITLEGGRGGDPGKRSVWGVGLGHQFLLSVLSLCFSRDCQWWVSEQGLRGLQKQGWGWGPQSRTAHSRAKAGHSPVLSFCAPLPCSLRWVLMLFSHVHGPVILPPPQPPTFSTASPIFCVCRFQPGQLGCPAGNMAQQDFLALIHSVRMYRLLFRYQACVP